MISTGCISLSKCTISSRTLWGKSLRLHSTARRSVHIVAYKEDEKKEKKSEEKIPDVGIHRQGRDTASQDISDQVPKPPRSLQDVVHNLQDMRPRYDEAPCVPLWQPAFTRRREVFVGRIAMLGFLGTMIGEIYTGGLGPIGQLSWETAYSDQTITNILMIVVAYNLFGGLNPWSPTFSRQNLLDIQKRPPGPPLQPAGNLKEFLGISEWGFTKANELFNGRLAMLGFLATVLGENAFGTGPIGQVAYLLGVPVNYSAVGMGLAIWVGLVIAISYLAGNYGQIRGAEDIY